MMKDSWEPMSTCPLNEPVLLLCDLMMFNQEIVGTIDLYKGTRIRGECIKGDPEYFYRSAIIGWKPLQEEE